MGKLTELDAIYAFLVAVSGVMTLLIFAAVFAVLIVIVGYMAGGLAAYNILNAPKLHDLTTKPRGAAKIIRWAPCSALKCGSSE